MKLPSRIFFKEESVKIAFSKLEHGDDSERRIYKSLSKAFAKIKENAFCGTQIQKELIPEIYKKKDIHNLWKYDLPDGWRLLYSIVKEEIVVVSIILDWLSHPDYEKRFRY